jgi:predicted RNA-binding protein with PUA-like domain
MPKRSRGKARPAASARRPAARPGANPAARSATVRARYWLLKSEPAVFSFDDLVAAPGRTTAWEGVRNYQARNFLRDDVHVGDLVLFYHSSAAPPAVAGVATIVRAAYPDPTQFDAASDHHDPGSDPAAPRWLAVDVAAVAALPEPVPIATLKAQPELAAMAVVQRGQRLSVQPVTAAEFATVLRLGGLDERKLRFGQETT